MSSPSSTTPAASSYPQLSVMNRWRQSSSTASAALTTVAAATGRSRMTWWSRWLPPSALWDLVNAEVSLLRLQQERYVELHLPQEDVRRDMGWISRMPATADERRRLNRDDFLGPFRPDAPWWEGMPQEKRATDYETYEALRNLPRTREEWLRREVAALGLVA